MSLWESVADLELRVDGYELQRRESVTPSGWTRVTTAVVLSGDGQTGQGEDVTYDAAMHNGVPDELMLAGTWSFEDFSRRLDDFEELAEGYRRWAFESAALDLALRQGEIGLGEALGRAERPVRFVVSTRSAPERFAEAELALPKSKIERGALERPATVPLGELLEIVEPVGQVLQAPRACEHQFVRDAVVHLGLVRDVLAQAGLARARERNRCGDACPPGGRGRFAPLETVIVDAQLQTGDRLPQRHTPSI